MRQMERRLKLQKIARLLAMLLTCVAVGITAFWVAREIPSVRIWCLCVTSLAIGAFFTIIAVQIAAVVKERREEAEGVMLSKVFFGSNRLLQTRKMLESRW